MENVGLDMSTDPPSSLNIKRICFKAIYLLGFGFLIGFMHYKIVKILFEENRNFTYLSNLEREMSLRTEMGFYYSYYKTLVEEEQFAYGIHKLLHDHKVEYPNEVNVFNRFNIHPELILAFIYRYAWPAVNATKECHLVHRGENLSPVTSCVGLGDQMLFYLEAVWLLAGVTLTSLFCFAYSLSGTVIGGIIASIQYLSNHAECTRVMWTPNERENFAQPFLLLQMWFVTLQFRSYNKSTMLVIQVALFFLNATCLLFWQFTQFVFATQTAILFLMEQLHVIDAKTLGIYLYSQFCGLHLAIVMLQGNDMLKSSFYICLFTSISLYCMFFSKFRVKVKNKKDLLLEVILILLRLGLILSMTYGLKKFLSIFFNTQDDGHIYEIVLAKFTNFKNFHTMLYTCSSVFDFLPLNYFENITATGLLPTVVFVVLNLISKWTESSLSRKRGNDSRKETEEAASRFVAFLTNFEIDPGIFYNVAQMAVFGFMALLVMRLKLLFTPHLCIVSAIAFNEHYYNSLFKKHKNILRIAVFPLVLLCVHQGLNNLLDEADNIGEYSDIQLETLINWILIETGPLAVFAGPMPLMATVMLTTRRPIVNHPHYEHVESRLRNYAVYKTYGKFTPLELYKELTKFKVNYLIIERKYCYGKSGKGCTFEEIWDTELPAMKNNPRLCTKLLRGDLEHFYEVYTNRDYVVLKLHDFRVSYTPLLKNS